MPDPILTEIIDLLRWAAPDGCMADEVALVTGLSLQAAKAALDLQVQAGVMSSEVLYDGERYVGTVYRMREGA